MNKLLFFYCCTLSISCNHSYQKVGFQEGDLLFQNLNCGELCNAIEAVTEGIDGKDFSHIALVVNVNDTLKVIEAIGNNVQINSLETFFSRSGDTAKIENVTVGRLKKQYKNLIPKAIAEAKKIIGQPYDNIFLLNNGKMYCSEMIYEIFKESNKTKDFFVLEPMTFKDPKTKVFFPAWVNYYKHLNKEIPEGLLGINPGLISRSNKISILKIENYK
ncbi:YiiX/YebB-like N1pC/P60 family cysteine hydrolase [Subsaximicrobium wynnwilliamsii]|uniref:YiiX/YebB-like N1pC/P60 family cysteine hydrolase n=1 Tax=Subsaximicrobium wynnwilliamsii TaxID=291179 RepID=UPI001CB8BD70|nr:YiiX/YebB-like N1pC/P60 family cysteine hydrolase [Subsaximicrobium wynnwilliamsii]